MLASCNRVAVWRIDDDNPALRCSIKVDVVNAYAGAAAVGDQPLQSLFGELRHPAPAHVDAVEGPFAAVALEQSIDRLLDYSIPKSLQPSLRVGQRVRVPLGRKNRTARGYVVSIHPSSDYPKIKPLSGIEDERVLFPPKLMELARRRRQELKTEIDSWDEEAADAPEARVVTFLEGQQRVEHSPARRAGGRNPVL